MSVRLATIGHVAPDVLEDGRERLGGAALYTALAALELGADVVVHTAGPRWLGDAVEALGLEVELQERSEPTRFVHRGAGDERRLQITGWAGRMEPVTADADAVLLVPVADELPARPARHDGFEVLLPQGLIRGWGADGWVTHQAVVPEGLAPDLIVAARSEAPYLEALMGAVLGRGGAVALTDGPRACSWRQGATVVEAEPEASQLADDVGAGDVFGAALTIARLRDEPPAEALRFAHATVAAHLPQIHARLGDR